MRRTRGGRLRRGGFACSPLRGALFCLLASSLVYLFTYVSLMSDTSSLLHEGAAAGAPRHSLSEALRVSTANVAHIGDWFTHQEQTDDALGLSSTTAVGEHDDKVDGATAEFMSGHYHPQELNSHQPQRQQDDGGASKPLASRRLGEPLHASGKAAGKATETRRSGEGHDGDPDGGRGETKVKAKTAAEGAPTLPATKGQMRSDGKMNVLFMMSDDMRSQMSLYGKETATPHLDRLAARGVTFDRAYSQVTVCNPSRNSFLTGRTPDVTQVGGWMDRHID